MCICSNIRFEKSCFYLFAVRRCVCRFRPHNRLSVTSGNEEKSFSHGRCSVISSYQLTELYIISQICKLLYKLLKSLALFCLNRMMSSVEWSPGFKFFHVLQHDYPRSYKSSPTTSHPCKTTDKLVFRLTAFGFGKVFAVRREPGKSYRMPVTCLNRIDLPNILTVMFRIGMISLVHPNSFWIMVDCNIHAIAGCKFYPVGSPTAPGKVIYYQFSVYHSIFQEPDISLPQLEVRLLS